MPFYSFDLRACLNPNDPYSDVIRWQEGLKVGICHPDLSYVDHFISIIENIHCLCFEQKSLASTMIGYLQTNGMNQNFIVLSNVHQILKKIGYTKDMDENLIRLNKSIKGKKQYGKIVDNDDQRKLDYIMNKYNIVFSTLSKKSSFETRVITICNITDPNLPLLLSVPTTHRNNESDEKLQDESAACEDGEEIMGDQIESSAPAIKRKLPDQNQK